MSAETTSILGHELHVELVGESSAWHRKLHASALVQDDTQVFDEMLDVEAWFEVAFEHAGAELLEPEVCGGTLGEKIDHLNVVQTSLLSV